MDTILPEEMPNADGSYSQLMGGEKITIKPGESRVVKCMLRWSSLSEIKRRSPRFYTGRSW